MPRLTTKIVAIAVIVALLALVLFVKSCADNRRMAREANVNKGQAEAAASSGEEALNTLENVHRTEGEVRGQVKEASDEIRKSPPGNSNDAALRAACSMRIHRDNERCAALRAPRPPVAD